MIRPRSNPRPGRLKGDALRTLRYDCYRRDGAKCTVCGRMLLLDIPWVMHPDRMHMAHVRNKRMFGDNLENVTSKCSGCHFEEHNPKPVPRKVQP